MNTYIAFQLTIQSELVFPELLQANTPIDVEPDVTIGFSPVSSDGLKNPDSVSGLFQANARSFWLQIPSVGRFLVEDGKRITIEPNPGVDEDSIRVFLLGSCFGALLIQRGLFLLHSNAIRVGDVAVSFTGNSGAGKSTLSGAFLKRGYAILADDVTAINSQLEALPSYPQIKLWADAAKQLKIDTTGLRKIRPAIEKYAVPLGEQFHHKPTPLGLVYILRHHNQDDIIIDRLEGLKKFQPLRQQTYHQKYIKGLGREREYGIQCGRLASQIDIARVVRPSGEFALERLVDSIEKDLVVRGILA